MNQLSKCCHAPVCTAYVVPGGPWHVCVNCGGACGIEPAPMGTPGMEPEIPVYSCNLCGWPHPIGTACPQLSKEPQIPAGKRLSESDNTLGAGPVSSGVEGHAENSGTLLAPSIQEANLNPVHEPSLKTRNPSENQASPANESSKEVMPNEIPDVRSADRDRRSDGPQSNPTGEPQPTASDEGKSAGQITYEKYCEFQLSIPRMEIHPLTWKQLGMCFGNLQDQWEQIASHAIAQFKSRRWHHALSEEVVNSMSDVAQIYTRKFEEVMSQQGTDGIDSHEAAIGATCSHAIAQATRELREEQFHKINVPGVWKCHTCGFIQHRNVICPKGIYANTETLIEPCPNEGDVMFPMTWEEMAKENQEFGVKLIAERDSLTTERDALKAALERTYKALMIAFRDEGYSSEEINGNTVITEARAALAANKTNQPK